MVSPEQLRRYAFFAGCTPAHLDAIALLSDDVTCEDGETLFAAGQPADALYILVAGCPELHYEASDPFHRTPRKDFLIGDFNVGEPFGISALIDPYRYVGTVSAVGPTRAIRIRGPELRALCASDSALELALLRGLVKATMTRLDDTRVLLVGERA